MNAPGVDEQPGSFPGTAAQDRIIQRAPAWRRHRRSAAAALAVVSVLGASLFLWFRLAGAERSVDRARLTIATVERGSFVRDVAAEGQVVAAVSPTLYASATGTVSLKMHAGDGVVKGQTLALIESPDLTAKLSQEEATLQSVRGDWQRAQLDSERKLRQLRDAYQQTEVDQKTAQRELDRSRKAYDLGSYSELQMLRAQDALEKAQFALQQAKLDYESQPQANRFDIGSKKALLDRQQLLVTDLKRQVDELNVRSPVDGQIGQVQVADRASVAKNAALLTVIDLSALEVEIRIPESLARDLKRGMTAYIEGGGGHWQGSVSGVSPEVVRGEVTARVRFDAERPAGLRQSQRLSVRILIDRRDDVLMVDRGAFVDQDGSAFTYLVQGNVAERRAIRVGASSIAKVEILDGLSAGDRIVVSGMDAFNGARRAILSN